jgi:hypothetical protein
MHDEVRDTLRTAIERAGAALEHHVGRFTDLSLVWRKQGEQWQAESQARPSLTHIFAAARDPLNAADTEFRRVFFQHHPEYGGMVSFPALGGNNFLSQPGFILTQVMSTLWTRHSTFQPDSGAIDAIIQELADFVDQDRVRFRFTAQLLNYRMDTDHIVFPGGLAIRRLSEQEVTEIHGGPLWQLAFTPQRSFGAHEYAVEGEYEEEKILGQATDERGGSNQVRDRLDKAVLAMRSFKPGPVGYDSIRIQSVKFCPLLVPSFGYADLYVPSGIYAISNSEVEGLCNHAQMIFACQEPSLEIACSRLADAQIRVRPHDRLVDAVFGLEALLLSCLRSEDRRGELKFRFSLHYSTLFGTPEDRYRAFRVAKDLYDLRSTIAHGSIPQGISRVGHEQLSLEDAALRACEALTAVVHRFLPQAAQAPFKQPQFWERGYFGLS